LARTFGLKLILGDYDYNIWKRAIAGYENTPEGGTRCDFCFRHRLHETAKIARKLKFNLFATSLTVSPHKNSLKINTIGERIGRWQGIKFLDEDFKNNNGWPRSLFLSKKFGFYRQKYCGCEYSSRDTHHITHNKP